MAWFITSSMPRRDGPMESMAPDLTRLSKARPFTTLMSTRSQKSKRPWKGPSSLARFDDVPDGVLPHVLDRVEPEADAVFHHPEIQADSLMSGGRTSMPISLATLT